MICLHQTIKAQLVYPNLLVQFDSVWTYEKLQLIPIRFKESEPQQTGLPSNIISLEEAMRKGKIQIKEFYYNGDANVHVLAIKNKSNQSILLQNGDMLKGGKQDRMIAESKIIPPKKENEFVEVYCIERGRWDKKAKPFTYAGNADAWLQKVMDSSNLQQQVWKEIEHRLPANNDVKTTWPYLQSFNDSSNAANTYIDFFTKKIKASDSLFAGFIAITDSSIISCEVFASTRLTLTAYNNLLQGWVHAVLVKGGTPAIPSKKLRHFTDELFTNEEKQKKFLLTHGKAYQYQNKVFHIVAYPKNDRYK